MIWFRRILAVLLAPLFIVSFLVALVLFRVNDTALNPDFYIDQLRKADIYAFLYDEALPVLWDEAAKETDLLSVDLEAVKADVIGAAREIFPPEWLQGRTEETFRQVLPYVTGDTDEFSVTLGMKDRVDVAAQVIKRRLREGSAFASLYDGLTAQLAEEAFKNMGELPSGLTVTQDDLLTAIRTVAPRDWLVVQIEQAIDQVAPYVKGTAQHFSITMPLADRAEAAGEAAKELAHKGDAYIFVMDSVVMPLVNESVSSATGLPYGVVLTRQEVSEAVRQALTREWTEAQFNDLVDAIVTYMTGKAETLSVAVPLAERREDAYGAVAALADRKLESLLLSRPECSMQQFTSQLPILPPGQLPSCRPAGASYAQAKQLLRIDTTALVRQALGEQVPEAWTFREAELREALGEEAWARLQDLRRWAMEGYTFTDDDLRQRLGPDGEEALDDFLRFTQKGVAFTQADLRDFISKGEGGPEALDNLDRGRSALAAARRWLWVLWLWLGLLLASIGFLGGRNWGSRAAWAASVLIIATLPVLVVAGPVYGITARPEVQAALEEGVREADPAMQPIAVKAAEMGLSVAEDFVGGIRNRAIFLLVVGLVGLGSGIAWQATHRPEPKPVVSMAVAGETPPREAGMAADRVILQGMAFYGYHGVQPEERAAGQKFVVDLEVEADLSRAGQSDDLKDTVSYSELYRAVREVVERPPRNLLEAVAEAIARRILEGFPVESVRVRIAKPSPPIKDAALESAAVEIYRRRASAPPPAAS